MATTKEKFTQRYNDVKENVIKALDKALVLALEHDALDLENMQDNYLDVYPLIAAALEVEKKSAIGASCYPHIVRKQKRQCKAYLNDVRIWFNY